MNKLTTIEVTNKVKIQSANLTACVVPLKDFHDTFPSNSPYGQINLKKAYRATSGVRTTANINFFLEKGSIYLLPESRQGLERDLEILRLARSIL